MPRREDYAAFTDEEYEAIVRQRLKAELAALLQSEIEAEIIEATIADLHKRGLMEEAEERQRHVEERRARIAAIRAHVMARLASLGQPTVAPQRK